MWWCKHCGHESPEVYYDEPAQENNCLNCGSDEVEYFEDEEEGMTEERFIEIMYGEYPCTFKGDKALRGFEVIGKYTDNVICGADHDIIWSEDISKLIEAGITQEDVENLCSLGFHIEDHTYLARFA